MKIKGSPFKVVVFFLLKLSRLHARSQNRASVLSQQQKQNSIFYQNEKLRGEKKVISPRHR